MARRRGFQLTPPHKITLLVAVLLWLFGAAFFVPATASTVARFAATIPGASSLPGNLGVWALAAAGLLMFIAVIFEGI